MSGSRPSGTNCDVFQAGGMKFTLELCFSPDALEQQKARSSPRPSRERELSWANVHFCVRRGDAEPERGQKVRSPCGFSVFRSGSCDQIGDLGEVMC